MAEKNSFKLLAEEEELLHIPPPEMEDNILTNLRILSVMGKSMEMFLPGAINMFVQLLGGTPKMIEQSDLLQIGEGATKKDTDDITPSDAGSDD